MAETTITEQLSEIKSFLGAQAKQDAEAAANAAVAEFKQKALDAEAKALAAEQKAASLEGQVQELKSASDKNQPVIDAFVVSKKKVAFSGEPEAKSFNQILADTIERNVTQIKGHKKGQGLVEFDMLPEIKAAGNDRKEVKAVGDMSIGANFPNATSVYQDVRGMIMSPYNRVWLSDILPGGTSDKAIVTYPKENGGEGAVALWEDPTTDKAQVDYDFTSVNAAWKWLAGIAIVDREMLDDIPFLTSYLQNKLLISLKTAENAFILNGSDPLKSNPVTGLLGAATAYSGAYTDNIDKLVDAAYGQIVEDTEEFYNPTTIVTMPRAAVKMGLTKASGSGEYNLPAGSVAFANGKLSIAGLDLVPTTKIGAGNFLAFDKNAAMYISRMAAELRIFEDATLAKKNKIMFRVEKRATLATFNSKAIVKGTLA